MYRLHFHFHVAHYHSGKVSNLWFHIQKYYIPYCKLQMGIEESRQLENWNGEQQQTTENRHSKKKEKKKTNENERNEMSIRYQHNEIFIQCFLHLAFAP